jgi:predicted HicB family RNase H-like nuclease
MFSFELPPDVERAARAEAARMGISLEEVVFTVLQRELMSLPPDEQSLQRKPSPEE